MSTSYLSVRNLSKKYYLTKDWTIDWPGKFPFAGTVFDYQRSFHHPERISAAGPTNETLVFEVSFLLSILFLMSAPESPLTLLTATSVPRSKWWTEEQWIMILSGIDWKVMLWGVVVNLSAGAHQSSPQSHIMVESRNPQAVVLIQTNKPILEVVTSTRNGLFVKVMGLNCPFKAKPPQKGPAWTICYIAAGKFLISPLLFQRQWGLQQSWKEIGTLEGVWHKIAWIQWGTIRLFMQWATAWQLWCSHGLCMQSLIVQESLNHKYNYCW